VRDLQPTNECKCRYIFTIVGNRGKLDLEVTNIKLEAITLPCLNGEEVMVVLLGLPARNVLSEEHFGCLLKVMKEWGEE